MMMVVVADADHGAAEEALSTENVLCSNAHRKNSGSRCQ